MKFPENPHAKNVLDGIRLQDILELLIQEIGWEEMGDAVRINCFHSNQTLKSSLKFLRSTPWARKEVEALYLKTIKAMDWKAFVAKMESQTID